MIGGTLTYGEFFLFYQLLLQLVWPLEALGWILSLAQRATASASRSFAWLRGDRDDPRADRARPRCPTGRSASRSRTSTSRTAPAARCSPGVDLADRAGRGDRGLRADRRRQDVAAQPAAALLRPDRGPRAASAASTSATCRSQELRTAVAIVTQRPILFSIPLRDNLTAARPDAPWDEVVAACEAAGVAQFAAELPDGYDTLIGERGVNLSGGQRQRVALARALVAGARVIVLDDPMSAVDTQTERHLVENLRPALAGRTVLIATQRLSTVEVADRAVVLDDGVIVESGTPQELLARGGVVRGALRRGGRGCRVSSAPACRGSAATSPASACASPRSRCVGVCSAAAPVAALLIVQDAIDKGMRATTRRASSATSSSTSRSTRSPGCCRRRSCAASRGVGQDVVLGLRQDLFDHLTTLSLRYFSQQKAGWIIARLTSDVDALSDVLSQGLTTLVVNTLTLARRDRRPLRARLAARPRRARDPAADARR